MSRLRAMLNARAAPAILSGFYNDNILTGLIPHLYAGLDVVSRELVGLVPSVNRNTGVERAAVGQSVDWSVTGEAELFDVQPSMAIPEPADQEVGLDGMKITDSKGVEFGVTGEEQRGLNTGVGALTVQGDLFAQGLRRLVNQIEADGLAHVSNRVSRLVGTAGTTPFSGTDLEDAALVRQILEDNGAPGERTLLIDTNAGVKIRKHAQLSNVDQAGSTMTVRQGELLPIFGMSLKESAGFRRHVAGTGAGATTNTAGYAEGSTVITLATAGTGTIKAGDGIKFAGDSNVYVVKSGDDSVANGGTITLAAPGLRQAIPAAATAITVTASHVKNLAFCRSAIGLAIRPPALPIGGDAAKDSFMLTDPRSGMTFEVRVYAGYRKLRYEVAAAWGWGVLKEEHIAGLIG